MPDWRALTGHRTHSDLWTWATGRLNAMGSKVVTNLNMGPFRLLLSLALEAVAVVYDIIADVIAPSGSTETATGAWLVERARDRGITPHEAVHAEGEVVFGRSAAGGPIPIPSGTIVKTDPGPGTESLLFITTVDGILPDGALTVTVPVRAEFPGTAYNVSAGAIRNLVTHVPGVDSVTNTAAWLTREGTDEESAASLRQRARLAWQSLASGGTEGAYRAWALEVPGVVEAVTVGGEPRGPGTLDVIVTSSTGAPTAQLLSTVQAHIDKRKPLLDNVLVKGPSTKVLPITVQVTLPPVGGDAETVGVTVWRRLNALFQHDPKLEPAVAPLIPGQGLNRAQIIWLSWVAPAENVVVTAPAVDEPAVPGQLLTAGEITVTVVRRA